MRKPFYKKSHGAWYVNHHGRMIRLSQDKEEAFKAYHELMASEAPASSNDSVATLMNSYLDWCKKNRSAQTYIWYKEFLSSFARSIGVRLRIGSLKPLHITQWTDTQEGWNDTTKHNAVRAVKRVFNWAVKEGRLRISPIQNVERPAPRRRESFLTSAQFELVRNCVREGGFRDYITFLFETGARPQEIRVIEAKHCDVKAGRIVLPASQAKGKQYPRLILLTPAAKDLVASLCQRHPDGPLFVNRTGHAWNKDSVNCRFRRIREQLEKNGTPIAGLCATSARRRSRRS
ncbi:MAG: tyrosine-type recombinase/integrase [Planctomycetaceae bacterium]